MDFKEKPKYSSIEYLFYAGTGSKFSPKTIKFKHILNDFDLDKPDNKLIDKLIETGFYYIDEEQREYCDDFVADNYELGCEIMYNNTPYYSNIDFYEELYYTLEGIVKCLYDRNFTKDISSVTLRLKSCFNNCEKIDFLKVILTECYDTDHEDAEEFSVFLEGHESWKYEIQSCIPFESEIFHYYLKKTEEEKLTSSRILNIHVPQWLEFYRRVKLIDFCRNKIEEIDTSKDSTIPIPSKIEEITHTNEELALFKGFGLNYFNCICSNYFGDRNPAFYSYLFFFLKTQDLLNVNSKTNSRKYVNYIKGKFGLEFSKVINSSANLQTEHNIKMIQFKKIIDTNLLNMKNE